MSLLEIGGPDGPFLPGDIGDGDTAPPRLIAHNSDLLPFAEALG